MLVGRYDTEGEDMIDQEIIDNIRQSGNIRGAYYAEKREKLVRQELGLRVTGSAEYALLTGCFSPFSVPDELRALGNLLKYYEVDYTLLEHSDCCGDIFFRQAVEDINEEDFNQADLLFREFFNNNLHRARNVGASKIITFCVGCNEVFSRYNDTAPEEVLWYPTLLASVFCGGKLDLHADYYAGCHRYYQRLNSTMPDLESSLFVLNQIEGLKLNQLDHSMCCTRPEQVESLISSVQNRTIITSCHGCAMFLGQAIQSRGDYRVVMLPQVAWAAVNGHTL